MPTAPEPVPASPHDAGERNHRNTRRALSFGALAQAYDRVRPHYPDSVIDAVVTATGRPGTLRVLDIGTGTGILARPLADRGHAVLGLDPDAQMAEIARSRGTDVVIERFEQWDGRDLAGKQRSFDLLVAAQCWHWLDPARSAQRAQELLVPGGVLALLWNYAVGFAEPAAAAVRAAYAAHVPSLLDTSVLNGAGPAGLAAITEQLRASGRFADVRGLDQEWTQSYRTADWLDVIATFSDHSQLADQVREPLLAAIAAAIDGAGGQYRVTYRTCVILAVTGRLTA